MGTSVLLFDLVAFSGGVKYVCGLSSVVTTKFDYDKFYNVDLPRAMLVSGKNLLALPNFVHQTWHAPNHDLVTEEAVNNYIDFIVGHLLSPASALAQVIRRTLEGGYKKCHTLTACGLRGVYCCNDNNLHMNASGDFLLCGYGNVRVGHVRTGVDWAYVDSFVHGRCKICPLWAICRNRCVMQITDNECRIFRAVYKQYASYAGVPEMRPPMCMPD